MSRRTGSRIRLKAAKRRAKSSASSKKKARDKRTDRPTAYAA